MDLKTSMDFTAIEHEILRSTMGIRKNEHVSQALKVLRNIQQMNTKLSQLEVEDRRMHCKNRPATREQVLQINNELENLRQWITLLILM
jgi:hypothetical protein